MQDTVRHSVMVLPRRTDGSILLQSWTNEQGTVTDGFGSFYQAGEDPKQTAQKVLATNFDTKALLTEAARLQYFITKPTGLVDLKVTVYFAAVAEDLKLQETMQWFVPSDVPYARMHDATGKWLPVILEHSRLLVATIRVEQPGDHTKGKVTEFTVS